MQTRLYQFSVFVPTIGNIFRHLGQYGLSELHVTMYQKVYTLSSVTSFSIFTTMER